MHHIQQSRMSNLKQLIKAALSKIRYTRRFLRIADEMEMHDEILNDLEGKESELQRKCDSLEDERKHYNELVTRLKVEKVIKLFENYIEARMSAVRTIFTSTPEIPRTFAFKTNDLPLIPLARQALLATMTDPDFRTCLTTHFDRKDLYTETARGLSELLLDDKPSTFHNQPDGAYTEQKQNLETSIRTCLTPFRRAAETIEAWLEGQWHSQEVADLLDTGPISLQLAQSIQAVHQLALSYAQGCSNDTSLSGIQRKEVTKWMNRLRAWGEQACSDEFTGRGYTSLEGGTRDPEPQLYLGYQVARNPPELETEQTGKCCVCSSRGSKYSSSRSN